MSDMVYVIMASTGEYSDRVEWICGIYRDEEVAKTLIEERSAAAREATSEYERWCAKRSGIVGWGWPVPPEIDARVLAECGPVPKNGEADGFWLVSVPMEVWGRFDEYRQEPRP